MLNLGERIPIHPTNAIANPQNVEIPMKNKWFPRSQNVNSFIIIPSFQAVEATLPMDWVSGFRVNRPTLLWVLELRVFVQAFAHCCTFSQQTLEGVGAP